jgi:AraC-like DNA-binding protein
VFYEVEVFLRVTAGIDLSLALLEEDHGAALALEVARVLVVFLRRPGNQAQFSVSLGKQSMERNPLRELRVWMAEHLTADLSVPALAQRVAMSPRNFQRVFTSGAGKSPARYVEELRIETARRLLERTTQSMDEIADCCGRKSRHSKTAALSIHSGRLSFTEVPPFAVGKLSARILLGTRSSTAGSAVRASAIAFGMCPALRRDVSSFLSSELHP